MFLWYPVLDLARAPRRTARKKGSGYENDVVFDVRVLDLNLSNVHTEMSENFFLFISLYYIIKQI
jgi:hypothetical protein